jgi:Protein of unknown function DUF262
METKTTISVKPDKIRLLNLLEEIAEGKINIPVFQRDFVWKKDQMKNLFDSISKGYPVGSLLFWNPDKAYKTLNLIGPYEAAQPKNNYYVLDGFQRITTLFGVLSNPGQYGKQENDIREFLIYYNLETKEFDFLQRKKATNIYQIPLYKIVDTFEYLDFIQGVKSSSISVSEQNKLINNAKEINKIFLDYHIPYVEINGGDIKSAVDIFSRVNSTGTEISEDFMLSALSYNESTDFLLSDSITDFLNSLNPYNFDNLKRDTILNCISNAKGKIYFDVKIEDLLNFDLEEFTNNAYTHIEKAVRFLYERIYILDVRLLPYPTQLIFISEFFRLNPNPSEDYLKKLEYWFWKTTYSNYFTLYSLSQQRSAYQTFCEFAVGQHPDGIYRIDDEMIFSTAKYPEKINFTGVRPKALQLFYLKSIIDTSNVSEREGIKEIFITSKRDRTPGNIIFRLSSEFEEDKNKKILDNFILYSSGETLEKYFIMDGMVPLYKEGSMDKFLHDRDTFLKLREKKFVESLGVKYIE